jgi:hypothetical protein
VNSFYLTIVDGDNRKCFVHTTFFTGHLHPERSSLLDQVLTAFLQKEKSAIIEVRMRQSDEHWIAWELYCLEAAGAAMAKLSSQSPEIHHSNYDLHKGVRQMLDDVHRHLNCPGTGNPDLEIIKNRTAGIAILAIEEVRRLSRHPK